MLCIAERKNALLGAGFFFISARATESSIELVFIKCLSQSHRFHNMGVNIGAMGEGANTIAHAVFIDMHQQLKALIAGLRIAKLDHLAEFPCRIDMQERKWRWRRIECLHRQMQHHRRVLAHRI